MHPMKTAFAGGAVLAVLLLAGCDERGDTPVVSAPVTAETPDSFLSYPNSQPSLAAGTYAVVAASADGGRGAYRLRVTFDDGSVREFSGRYGAGAGPDAGAAGNGRHAVTLAAAGGLRVDLSSADADAHLYLLRDGRPLAEDADSGPGRDARIELAASRIHSAAYGEAYYRAVDPRNERTTLADWKKRNGFDDGYDAHAVFRDRKDLGYGRNMYARRNADGSLAFFVENYVVPVNAGGNANYGPVNVEAAAREDRRYHIGTNAIEFSPVDPDDPASEKVAKFFTFAPDGRQERIASADLDGRGVKHMPQMCWVCHGGRLLPLEEDGSFPLQALRSAKLNPLEVDSFEYADVDGYSRERQERAMRTINALVYDSFLQSAARPAAEAGRWEPGFALAIAAGRYGGAGFDAPAFRGGYIPPGWRQTAARPEGVEVLYKRVVEPHCIGCHSLQGTSAGEDVVVTVDGQPVSLANAINFSSWEKFASYNDRIIDYVYQRGIMPASLRNYEEFWRDPDGAPALLAGFLDGFDGYDANGRVVAPGLPVARPGAAITARAPVRLDGGASLFASGWEWTLLRSPPGARAVLEQADGPRPLLRTDRDGLYVVGLRVSNARGRSEPARVEVRVDAAAPPAARLTFVDDIRPILGSDTAAGNCVQCHRADTTFTGIPVSWRDDNPALYRDVVARVNLAEPGNSPLLTKPASLQHGGGIRLAAGSADWQRVLDWIRAGAACGDDPATCR